jgi:hypothetical protein
MFRTSPPQPRSINENSFKDLVDTGNRIADDVVRLEKLIWLMRAEAYAQLDDASKAYSADFANNGILSDANEKLSEVSEHCKQLAALWEQARQLRNRGVKFSDLNFQKDFGPALTKVFENRKDR